MTIFGEESKFLRKDVQFLAMDECADFGVSFPRDEKYVKACNRISACLFALLSARSVMPIGYLRGKTRSRILCFPRLMAGLRPLTYLRGPVGNEGGCGAFLRQFRDFVSLKNRIAVPETPDVFRILIASKRKVSFNSRGISNADEVADFLRTNLPNAKGKKVIVDSVNLAKLDTKAQIKLIASADVWITPSGGTAFAAPFMKSSPGFVVFPFCIRAEGREVYKACNGGMCCFLIDRPLFEVSRINFVYYPARVPDDVVGKCSCQSKTCVDCNLRVRGDAMLEIVQRCLFYSQKYVATHKSE